MTRLHQAGLLLWAVLMLLGFQDPETAGAAPITVWGTVQYSDQRIPGVQVELADAHDPSRVLASTQTDDRGYFFFEGVGPGEYSLYEPSLPGYISFPVRVRVTPADTASQGHAIYLMKQFPALSPAVSGQLTTFSWEPGPLEAVQYRVNIATGNLDEPSGTLTTASSFLGALSYTSPLPLCSGRNRWEVMAYDGAFRPVGITSPAPEFRVSSSGPGAPSLKEPACGRRLDTMDVTLGWDLPVSTTQYHLQVIPFHNDGPGINVIRNAGTSYALGGPVFGEGNYVLLPGMAYSWRVRGTLSPAAITEADPAWGAWSDWSVFRTPYPTSDTIGRLSPGPGETASRTPTVQWSNSDSRVFYYEVQISKDPQFRTNAATALAAVYWVILHGAVTSPPNSYTVPAASSLEPGTTYHWRVRPRLQGDNYFGIAWSQAGSFQTR